MFVLCREESRGIFRRFEMVFRNVRFGRRGEMVSSVWLGVGLVVFDILMEG